MTDTKLPNGWIYASGEELFKFIRGVTFQKTDASNEQNECSIGILRANNIQNNSLLFDDLLFISKEIPKNEQILQKGDIVVATSSGSSKVVGKAATVKDDTQTLSFGAFCGVLRPHLFQISAWLSNFMNTEEYRRTISEKARGVNINNLKSEDLLTLSLPLPPLNEQKRIVAKVEALRGHSSRARAALEAVEPLLERFRQSVLAAAFRGDLTRAWREQHPDVEPAEVLLGRIREERKRRWIEDAAEKARAKAEEKARQADHTFSDADGQAILEKERSKAAEKYIEPPPLDTTGLPELPKGWCWARLEEIADCSLGKMLDRSKHTSGIELPYLRNENVRWNKIKTDDLFFMFFEIDEIARYSVHFGDVLVCEGGEPGRAAIWTDKKTVMYQKALHRIRPYHGLISQWFVFRLWHDALSGHLERFFTGSTIKHLTSSSLSRYVLPVAPTLEQDIITSFLSKNLLFYDTLKHHCSMLQSNLQQLDQSILAKAFRGELVAQDPQDEPASVLLERIKGEREAGGGTAKRGGRKNQHTPKP